MADLLLHTQLPLVLFQNLILKVNVLKIETEKHVRNTGSCVWLKWKLW